MKKIISILTLTIILSYLLQNVVLGITPTSLIQLDGTKTIDTNLEIYDGKTWSKWEPNYVYYTVNGISYPAYGVIHAISNLDETGYHDIDSNNRLVDDITWRVIINGFPYKTYEQIGVETEEDAYLATKAAVYCITVGRDSKIFKGPSEKEEKIISAIQNLINKAFDWSKGQKSATLEVEKKGDYEISNDYYSQSYIVSSNVEIDSFQITQMTGVPEGSFIANMEEIKQEEFTEEREFKVMIPKSKITKEMNGIIYINAKCNTYPIYYRT